MHGDVERGGDGQVLLQRPFVSEKRHSGDLNKPRVLEEDFYGLVMVFLLDLTNSSSEE